jgi:hypothetical protein
MTHADRLRAALRPVRAAPPLWRVWGVGTTMLGCYTDKTLHPAYHSVLCFTVLFVPVIPICIYFVSNPKDHGPSVFRFHAKIRTRDLASIYPGSLVKLFLSVMIESIAFVVSIVLVFAAIAYFLEIFRRR